MPPTITEKGNTQGAPGTSKRSTAGSCLKGSARCLSKEHDTLFPQREKVLIKKTTYRGKSTKLIFPNDVTDLMTFRYNPPKTISELNSFRSLSGRLWRTEVPAGVDPPCLRAAGASPTSAGVADPRHPAWSKPHTCSAVTTLQPTTSHQNPTAEPAGHTLHTIPKSPPWAPKPRNASRRLQRSLRTLTAGRVHFVRAERL